MKNFPGHCTLHSEMRAPAVSYAYVQNGVSRFMKTTAINARCPVPLSAQDATPSKQLAC